MCTEFRCGRMVCPDCGTGCDDGDYYRKTLCKDCEKRSAIEDEERKQKQHEAEALEARRKVFGETMVRIEISRLCRTTLPCVHGVVAYDVDGQSCDMGGMGAHAIHDLMVKLNQPLDGHIENAIRIYESFRPKSVIQQDGDADERKERCKEWGFSDM